MSKVEGRRCEQGARPFDAARTSRGLAGALAALLLVATVDAAHPLDLAGRVVDAGGEPLAEAVVFVDRLPPGAEAPPPATTAAMDQVQKQFVPHVLPVVVGTSVTFPNHDQIHHHVYSFSRTKPFELPLYKGEDAPAVTFDQLGAAKIGCNIHDWMDAVILVVPTPFFAVTDAAGLFVLRGLPAGSTDVVAWHERQKGSPEATRKTIEMAQGAPPVTFEIDVAPPRPRPAPRGGARSYE
jgi:plastocyanin